MSILPFKLGRVRPVADVPKINVLRKISNGYRAAQQERADATALADLASRSPTVLQEIIEITRRGGASRAN